jgi:hypothetical protein
MNFTIGPSGVNTSISGTGTAIFDGDFNFNLSGASTASGDSWTIVNVTSQTFDPTFTVVGFTDIGGNSWTRYANGTIYRFDEATGVLWVPEPSSLALLFGGAGMLLGFRRWRRA